MFPTERGVDGVIERLDELTYEGEAVEQILERVGTKLENRNFTADRGEAPPLRVKEVIRHGDYHNEREEEFPSTFDGFLGFLAGGPYAAAGGDHSKNQWVAKAWDDLQSKGMSSFGWAVFHVVGVQSAQTATAAIENRK